MFVQSKKIVNQLCAISLIRQLIFHCPDRQMRRLFMMNSEGTLTQ
jgi:hypothetical protein